MLMLFWWSCTGRFFETTAWVRAKGAVSVEEKEENVDCLTAKKRMKKCDAKCPLDLTAPQTFKGHEVCVLEQGSVE